MKFGLMAPYQLAPVEEGHFAADLGRLAEDTGFESIWAVDHVVMCPDYASKYPYDPSGRSPFDENVIQPDPLIWLTWVASATTTLNCQFSPGGKPSSDSPSGRSSLAFDQGGQPGPP